MSRKFGLIAVILVIIGAVFGGIFGRLPITSSADGAVTQEKVVADYREALQVIDANYVSGVDHESSTCWSPGFATSLGRYSARQTSEVDDTSSRARFCETEPPTRRTVIG